MRRRYGGTCHLLKGGSKTGLPLNLSPRIHSLRVPLDRPMDRVYAVPCRETSHGLVEKNLIFRTALMRMPLGAHQTRDTGRGGEHCRPISLLCLSLRALEVPRQRILLPGSCLRPMRHKQQVHLSLDCRVVLRLVVPLLSSQPPPRHIRFPPEALPPPSCPSAVQAT